MRRLMGCDRDKETVYQLPLQAKQTRLGENWCNLLSIKIDSGSEKQRKTPKRGLSQAELYSFNSRLLHFSPAERREQRARAIMASPTHPCISPALAQSLPMGCRTSGKKTPLQCGLSTGCSSLRNSPPAPAWGPHGCPEICSRTREVVKKH